MDKVGSMSEADVINFTSLIDDLAVRIVISRRVNGFLVVRARANVLQECAK